MQQGPGGARQILPMMGRMLLHRLVLVDMGSRAFPTYDELITTISYYTIEQ